MLFLNPLQNRLFIQLCYVNAELLTDEIVLTYDHKANNYYTIICKVQVECGLIFYTQVQEIVVQQIAARVQKNAARIQQNIVELFCEVKKELKSLNQKQQCYIIYIYVYVYIFVYLGYKAYYLTIIESLIQRNIYLFYFIN